MDAVGWFGGGFGRAVTRQWLPCRSLAQPLHAHPARRHPLTPFFLAPQFAQWAHDPSFRLFDYGSKAANRGHYGTDRPPSLAGEAVGKVGWAEVRAKQTWSAIVANAWLSELDGIGSGWE